MEKMSEEELAQFRVRGVYLLIPVILFVVFITFTFVVDVQGPILNLVLKIVLFACAFFSIVMLMVTRDYMVCKIDVAAEKFINDGKHEACRAYLKQKKDEKYDAVAHQRLQNWVSSLNLLRIFIQLQKKDLPWYEYRPAVLQNWLNETYRRGLTQVNAETQKHEKAMEAGA